MNARLPHLELRPVRPSDRDRVEEITRDVFGGQDYVPAAFEEWVEDPSAPFEAAELDGEVVAVHRLRPIASGVMLYQGLRVAPDHRREGVGRAMLRHALDQAAGLGFSEVRLDTAAEETARLYESEGFHLLSRCRVHLGPRVEGVDPPRMASPEDAPRLARLLRPDDPWLRGYGAVTAGWEGPRDVDQALLERYAAEGRVRVGPGNGALALLEEGEESLSACFLVGEGAALEELLQGLRVEADSVDVPAARLLAPDLPMASELLESVGYRVDDAHPPQMAYGRRL